MRVGWSRRACLDGGEMKKGSKPRARPGGRTERTGKAVAEAVLTFLRQGRADFEIQEISALSGVHRTTISRRWPDRGALVAEAMGAHVGRLVIDLSGDWEVDIRRITWGLFRFFGEPTELLMNRMLAVSDNILFHQKMAEYWAPILKKYEEPIRIGKEAGLIRQEVDSEMILTMISSVLAVYTALTRLRIDPDFPDRLADQIISLCRA